MKKSLVSIILITILLVSGCGVKEITPESLANNGDGAAKTYANSLKVYSFVDDFKTQLDTFEQNNNCGVNIEKYDIKAIPNMLEQSNADEPCDVVVLDQEAIKDTQLKEQLLVLDELVDDKYAFDIELQDAKLNEQLVAMPFRVYPNMLFYRRSFVEATLGESEPATIEEYLTSYEGIETLASKLKGAGVYFLANKYSFETFKDIDNKNWISESKFSKNEGALNYFNTLRKLKLDSELAEISPYSSKWFESMHSNTSSEYKVFAYPLPSYAFASIIMKTGSADEEINLGDDEQEYKVFNETNGDWAIATIPNAKLDNVIYVAINKDSTKIEQAQKLVEYMCSSKEQFVNSKNVDFIPANKNLLEGLKFDAANKFTSGEDYYEKVKQVLNACPKKDELNKDIDEIFDTIVNNYLKEEYHTTTEAVNVFATKVKEEHPELF